MRKILFPFALLLLSGCATLGAPTPVQPEKEFRAASASVKAKRYQDAIVSYNKIIAAAPGTALSADALFELALVYAYWYNPERDYIRAMHAFEEFFKRFPDDRRAREVQNWISVLKQVVELKKENEKLKLNIEQLERLDIKHEERRRTR